MPVDSPDNPTLGDVIGANVRRLREERGWPQHVLAKKGSQVGLSWTRDTVASVETGRRSVSIEEILLLAACFEVGAGQFLMGRGEVQLGESGPTHQLEGCRELLSSDRPYDPYRHVRPDPVREASSWEKQHAAEEVEKLVSRRERAKPARSLTAVAAERFDVLGYRVAQAAHQLWGHTLDEEYSARVDERVDYERTPFRSIDAIKGHVTRELLKELDPVLKPKKKNKK